MANTKHILKRSLALLGITAFVNGFWPGPHGYAQSSVEEAFSSTQPVALDRLLSVPVAQTTREQLFSNLTADPRNALGAAEDNFDTANIYRLILADWLARGGPQPGAELETAIDRDEQALRNMRRSLSRRQQSYVVGIDARVVGQTATFENQGFRDTVAILQTSPVADQNDALAGLCSGVLVSDLTVLTAAHCVCNLNLLSEAGRSTAVVVFDVLADRRSQYVHSFFDKTNFAAARRKIRVSNGVSVARKPILFNPAFCLALKQNKLLIGQDLALLFLSSDRKLKNGNPAVLEQLSDIKLTTDRAKTQFASEDLITTPALNEMTVVGFGISDFISADRRYWPKVGVRVPIVDVACTSAFSRQNYRCLPRREAVLSDWQFGGDTCRGDSGGPAYIRYFGAYYLAGITSRSASGGRCGEGGVYTLMTRGIVNWIDRHKLVGDARF